ncbi:MAG: sulfatase [Planctomycetes bacterium]|nr:sulfatase [Planctomycetota bacterium]
MIRWLLIPCLCALVIPSALHAQAKKRQPNIIFIMADDHANAAIGAYKSWLGPVVKTPNLDKLARQGIRFTNSMVTNSICTPSRAAILTGQYSHKNGVYTLADQLDKNRQHLAHFLRQLGYQTAMIGKWHLGIDPTGFDYWNILPGQGVYINPRLRAMGMTKKGLKEYKGQYSTDVITDLSLEWLKKRDKKKPFMLFCHFKAPHRPWDPAPRFKDLYKGVMIPEPETLQDDYKGRAKQVGNIKMRIGQDFSKRDLQMDIPKDKSAEELRKWAYQHYLKRYLSCIAAVDENVGRLMAYLDAEGLTEDTIVIYTSDQGFFLGEHGWYDKRLMYEPCLTTPLIIRWPGQTKPGTVNDDMILNIDHAPTFLDIAGAAAKKEMQGKSYKSILQGKTPPGWRQSIYYRYWMHLDGSHNVPAHYGVRTRRHTLIHYYGKHLDMKGARKMNLMPEWELFDRQKDPRQIRNVYADPTYAATVRELRVELDRLRREFGDER